MISFRDERAVLHLDADAFFASVEQRDDPKLRGKPVAVGTGVVASCSYEARHYGVQTGMRLGEARHLCRPLIILPGEYPRYEQAARRMLAVCQEQTPCVEAAALDDLYLDLTQRLGGVAAVKASHPAEQVAQLLRGQIREEISLSVSIGIASNKLVAKVATKDAKPGRHVCVPAGEEREYLAPWPARVLPDVGPKVEARLGRLNVQRVGEVAQMPVPILRGLFGPRGPALHEQALGIDLRPVEPCKPPQSVSRRTSFDPLVADHSFLRAMLDYLLGRASSWLRFQNLATRGLTLVIRYGDYESADGRAAFRLPTNRDSDLREAAHDRFETLYQRRLPLRLLGVELTPLVPEAEARELFSNPDAERARRLAQCQDAIQRRFGFTSLLSGSALLLAQRLDHDRENFHLRTPCLTR
jgi:DNA polymerase-4